jgi:hypothetical protein
MADSLAAALAELQADLPHVAKDADAQYGKYADLAVVTKALFPKLAAHGFSFNARPTLHPEFGFVLAYQLLHETGERSGFYPLPDPAKYQPQHLGSAITYARRYCLCAVTGCAPDKDDDDGQAAEQASARADGLPVNKDGSLSRSRTTDAEKQAAGVMTGAQQAGHTSLRNGADGKLPPAEHAKVEKILGMQPDDPFYGIPGNGYGPDTDTEDRHGTATADQIRDLNIRLTSHGHTKRDDKLAELGRLLGVEVKSSKDLSFNQAAKVLRELPAKRTQASTKHIAALERELGIGEEVVAP